MQGASDSVLLEVVLLTVVDDGRLVGGLLLRVLVGVELGTEVNLVLDLSSCKINEDGFKIIFLHNFFFYFFLNKYN